MPVLRFKDANGHAFEAPDELTIHDLFDKVKTTNKDGQNKNVITNSAEHGLIPQRDFFDKDIAVDGNTSKYTIITDGDFVYNPRKSSTAPYGPFNCYTRKEPGIVSPLYFCLTPKNKEFTPYLLYYFASPAWYSYIYHNGNQGGARHDRVGMTNSLLQGIPVTLPCLEEQKKITTFLSLYDEYVKTQDNKVDALEKRRKGLLQQIFSKDIRFKDEEDNEYADWQEMSLDSVLLEYNEKSSKDGIYEHVSKTKEGVIPKTERYNRDHLVTHEDKEYRVTHLDDICYNPANLKFGVICRNKYKDAIFSPIYVTFKVKKGFIPAFVERLLVRNSFIQEALQYQEGSIYERMAVSPEDLLSMPIDMPSLPEQKKIAQFFDLIDKQIQVEKDKLEAIKLVKKGLLQQMFV